jgi:hypothetical protein
MAILKPRLALLGLALLAGCERAADPLSYSEASHAVFGLVVAGADDARVLVTRFDPAGGATRGVRSADVRLWTGADTVRLAAAVPGLPCFGVSDAPEEGCYSARLPRPARPGERWELRVRFPDGAVASGVAVVPAAPAMQAPAAGARIPVARRGSPQPGGSPALAEIEVSYTPDPLTREFDVLLSPGAGYVGGGVLPGAVCGPQYRLASAAAPFTAPTRVLIRITHLECTAGTAAVAWDSIVAGVEVVAYDTAVSRYLREVHHADAVRRERASAGITGAYGVFGAAARARQPVTLVAQP